MFEVNFIAVLAAAVANIVLGFVWYHPKVFGNVWMRLTGLSPEMMESGKKRMPLTSTVAFIAGIVVAYVMSQFAIVWGVFDIISAIELAFWAWLGLVAPVLLGSVLWDQKPLRLYFINAGYWLVALILIATILILFA